MSVFGRGGDPQIHFTGPEYRRVKQAQLPEAVAASLKSVREKIGGEAKYAPVIAGSLLVSRYSTYSCRVLRLGSAGQEMYQVNIDYNGTVLRSEPLARRGDILRLIQLRERNADEAVA